MQRKRTLAAASLLAVVTGCHHTPASAARPLADVSVLQNVKWVMLRGRVVR